MIWRISYDNSIKGDNVLSKGVGAGCESYADNCGVIFAATLSTLPGREYGAYAVGK
jgi:hypothetical protein